MDYKGKLGQMILMGLDVNELNDEIIEIINKYKIGGVILYKKNYNSIDEMVKFINKLKEINKENIPMFISIDQENGRVNRFPNDINNILSPLKQAFCNDINIINMVNEITVDILKKVGVNMNFAPVLDINRDKSFGIIGNRSYGNNVDSVCKYAFPFINEMKKNKIISVVKHFPGHGATNKDSHFNIPKINDVESLKEYDLKVFERAISNGVDGIMVGHLKIKGYGREPASINKRIINELLIDKYNYNGLIITDDMIMNKIKYIYGLRNAFFKSILAGSDLIMIKYRKGDINFYDKIFKFNENEILINRINESYDKIIRIKNKYEINNNLIKNNIDIAKYNDKISKVNEMIEKKIS